jgi:hypothetical protein
MFVPRRPRFQGVLEEHGQSHAAAEVCSMSRKRDKGRREGGPGSGRASADRSLPAAVVPSDPVEVLIVRARKSRLRGEERRAVVLLREACALDERRPRTWAIAGALFAALGQVEEAARAFKQARWLRLRAGERARVEVLDRLLGQLMPAAA